MSSVADCLSFRFQVPGLTRQFELVLGMGCADRSLWLAAPAGLGCAVS
jgi:hypothetical protein